MFLGSAQAAVYRCGNTYQDSPCVGGQRVQVEDTRSEAQRVDALNAQRSDRQRADDLEAERHARERHQRPATAPAGIAVRQLDELDALPSDHPCAPRKGARAAGAGHPRCLNGLPVYSTQSPGSRGVMAGGR